MHREREFHSPSQHPAAHAGRCGRLAAGLLGLMALVVGIGAWSGPKLYRKLSGSNLHQVWVVQRHQEVERYGEALEVFAELRLEIPPAEAGVGRLIADLSLDLVEDGSQTLEELTSAGPVVLAHRAPGGPRHADRGTALRALEQRYTERGVRFLHFYTDSSLDAGQALADRDSSGLTGSVVLDPEGVLGRELGLRTTSDVFLLDSGRTLAYRGAIDDARIRSDGTIEAGHRPFLASALDTILAGRPVVLSATRAMGASLSFDEPAGPRGVDEITWTNRVQRILQTNCLSCHNGDGVAGISLETYDQVRGRRGMIRYVLEDRSMPPWMAMHDSGPWRNGLELHEEDRADVLAWIDAGAPEGDPADAAVHLSWPAWNEWVIGEPDYIVHAEDPIPIPKEGVIPIQKFTVSVPFPEDRWVQAIQLLPSTKGVLHHATIFMQPPSSDRLLFLDALLPGKTPTMYPEGQARFIAKGTLFKFIIHYTPNGEESEDLLRLGLKYAEEPPFREVHSIWMTNNEFVVPAHAKDYKVTAEFTLPRDVLMKQFMPHMHLRGDSLQAEALTPSGEVIELLNLPRWNLDWQYAYELYEPVFLPEGTLIRCTGTYDNSADNPVNPDPSRNVPFGQQTFDEMLGFGMDFIDP